MLGLVALDFVLRFIHAGVTRMALVLGLASVNLDDSAGYKPSFRIPADVVADFEVFHDEVSLRLPSNARARTQTFSTVRPYSRSISLPGADAPKRSTLSTSPESPTYLRQP